MVAARLRRAESAAPPPHPLNYPPRMGLRGGEGPCRPHPHPPGETLCRPLPRGHRRSPGRPAGLPALPPRHRGARWGPAPPAARELPQRCPLSLKDSPHPRHVAAVPRSPLPPAAPRPPPAAPPARLGPARPRSAVQMLKVPAAPGHGPARPACSRRASRGTGCPRAVASILKVRVCPAAVPCRAVPTSPRQGRLSPRDRFAPTAAASCNWGAGTAGAACAFLLHSPSISIFIIFFTESHTSCTGCSLCSKAKKAPQNPPPTLPQTPPGTPLLRFRPLLLFLPACNPAPIFYLQFIPPVPRSSSGESLAAPMNTQGSPGRFSMWEKINRSSPRDLQQPNTPPRLYIRVFKFPRYFPFCIRELPRKEI